MSKSSPLIFKKIYILPSLYKLSRLFANPFSVSVNSHELCGMIVSSLSLPSPLFWNQSWPNSLAATQSYRTQFNLLINLSNRNKNSIIRCIRKFWFSYHTTWYWNYIGLIRKLFRKYFLWLYSQVLRIEFSQKSLGKLCSLEYLSDIEWSKTCFIELLSKKKRSTFNVECFHTVNCLS